MRKSVRLAIGSLGIAAAAAPANTAAAATHTANGITGHHIKPQFGACVAQTEDGGVWDGGFASARFWYAIEPLAYSRSICIGTVDGTVRPNNCNGGLVMRTKVWGMSHGNDTLLYYSHSVGGTMHGGCGVTKPPPNSITYADTVRSQYYAGESPYLDVCIAFWYPASNRYWANPDCFKVP
jgi:hypothetical protein